MANNKDFIVKNAVEVGGATKVTLGDAAAAGSYTAGYGLESAAYDSVFLAVGSQDTNPQDIFFKPDGTKAYIIGSTNDTVYQYSLSTAWDVSTMSYDSVSFSVASQDTNPYGFSFKSDGTKMYVIGDQFNSVFQYSLSTAWDLSTASYDSVSLDLTSQTGGPIGITFKPDGTKMYYTEYSTDNVFQYSLGTAWDLSTASYDSVSFSVASQSGQPWDIEFSPDGKSFFIADAVVATVFKYTLTTAWDLSTASYSNVSFSISSQDANLRSVAFNDDGSKMYVTGTTNDRVYQYSTGSTVTTGSFDLSTGNYFTDTPSADVEYTFSNAGDVQTVQVEVTEAQSVVGYGDVSTWAYDSVSFSVASQASTPDGVAFNAAGTKMYVLDSSTDTIYQYSLSTGFDISTASYDSVSFSVSSQDLSPVEIAFNSTGSKMYILGDRNDSVFQYSLSTAFDLSTASYDSVSFSVASQTSTPLGLAFSSDGTKMYIAGYLSSVVYQYSLSTAFDLSTASYDSVSFSVSQVDLTADLVFNADGTNMYILDRTNNNVEQYSLSTAFDLSTTSYDGVSFSVASQSTSPFSMVFNSDGTKMYVGDSNDTIYQYSTASSTPITITWDADIEWAGGTAPDSPAAGEKDLYTITTDDGGTTYFGVQSGDAFS